jgi:membrane protein
MMVATKAEQRGDALGRGAERPSEMPAAGWKDIALRTWRESSKDNVGLVAAGVAFYGFLALVPLLGAIVITYGLVADPATVVEHAQAMTAVLPRDVAVLVGTQLMNVVETSGGKKGLGLLLALAVALWGARNAAASVVTALNIAYEEEETRGIVRTTMLALAMTAASVVLALLAGSAMTLLGYLHHLFPGTGPLAQALWKTVTCLLLGGAAAAAAATLYRYGPARDKAKWRWLTPGSLFFAVAWVLLTLGFGYYAANFGNYGATYGSLSAIVVLLTWLYLSSYVLLFGAEFNSEIEHQTARDTTAGAPQPIGRRGAWSADHVAGESEPAPPSEPGAHIQVENPHEPDPAPGAQLPEVPARTSAIQAYAASRVGGRIGRLAGVPQIGMVSSVLATAGLAMLRQSGRARAGAALLATAAGISLLKRD